MAYRVELAKSAETQLEDLYLWLSERAPSRGAKWFNGLERAILSLDQHPKRCPIAPDNIDPDSPIRILRYGRRPRVYRVFFTIDENKTIVRVIHIRRGARGEPAPAELTE